MTALPELGPVVFDARQRMVAADPAAMRETIRELRAALPTAQGRDEFVVLRRLGLGLLLIGQLDEALPVLTKAVGLAKSHSDTRAEIAARLNLGDAHRYAGDLDRAGGQYSSAVREARSSQPDLIDFALQHRGKHLIDAGRPAEAIKCLEEALRLRQAKGDRQLIDATTTALDLAVQAAGPRTRK